MNDRVPGVLALALLWASVACGDEPAPPQTARVVGNIFLVDTRINEAPAPTLVVDTGAPLVAIDPMSLINPPVFQGMGTLENFEVLGRNFSEVPVLFEPLVTGNFGGAQVSGVVGCTLFCNFALALDYQGQTVALDRATAPEGADLPVSINFEVRGGGSAMLSSGGEPVALPASRVLFDGTIEGRAATFMLDTGASLTTLASDFAMPLLEDGRGTIQSSAQGQLGEARAIIFRSRTIDLGAVKVRDSAVVTGTDFAPFFTQLEAETGRKIDVLLGGTFLREFYVTVNYPESQLTLQRYIRRDHFIEEGYIVGFEVGPFMPGDPLLSVSRVFEGTNAASLGIVPGDRIAIIEGREVGSLNPQELAGLLSGRPGEIRSFEFGCDGCPGFMGSRSIAVDYDLLALP